jgi:Fe-S-cluster containining protein
VEKIEKLADEVRRGLSDFCINECKAFCCRDGFIKLKPLEADLYCEGKKEQLTKEGSLKEMWNGKYILEFKNSCGGCPALNPKNFHCKIHSDINRSNTCKDFPIFIVGKEIKISPRCPAKVQGKFFKFEKEAIRLGYKIVDSFFD